MVGGSWVERLRDPTSVRAARRWVSQALDPTYECGSILPSPLDLAAGAHVVDQRAEGVEADLGDVGIGVGLGSEPFLAIADGGAEEPHAAVEPGATAEAADHGDLHRLHDRSTGHRSGIGEVEQRRARIFEQLGFRHELRRHFRRCLRARRRLRAVGDAVLPVSYTHLDVYKRQPQHRPPVRNW